METSLSFSLGKAESADILRKVNININASPSNMPRLGFSLSPVLKAALICCEILISDCSMCKPPQGLRATAQLPGPYPTRRGLEFQVPIKQQAASFSRCNELTAGTLYELRRENRALEKVVQPRIAGVHFLTRIHWPVTSAADTPGPIDLFIVF